MPETETDIEKRNKYGMLCGIVGIFLNLILFAGKLFAGMLSGAISITADAFNNLSDAGSSIITIAGFKMAAQRADGSIHTDMREWSMWLHWQLQQSYSSWALSCSGILLAKS